MRLTALLQWLRKPFRLLPTDEIESARTDKATNATTRETQRTEDPSKSLIRWVANLGATIVSGLGLAGVVGLIGAAVVWERFHEAGLPAIQALDVVPDSQLAIEGAAGIIGALLLASLAVIILFSLDRTGQITNATMLALAVLWILGVGYAILETELGWCQVLMLAVLGLVLAGASIGIGRVTGAAYVPFAAAVFISTVVFGGALSFALAAQENFVQPAAVLRSPGGPGIRGFYISDNDEFIWIGVIRPGFDPEKPDDSVPMYRIPRDDETRLLVGQLQDFETAVRATETLRQRLTAADAVRTVSEAEEATPVLPPDEG